eukprot:CAMPEP_0185205566 /NCGR_PEP_ID=MMETSP1140-20130426/56841_1 /TAXON_ID=298111 /ORGANISM="Pavlova sp., Strain CCMP459" /LENGTH=42 /DNA_ID= /DNA_START= /DNA_END= /DNA_ORIENTATION=
MAEGVNVDEDYGWEHPCFQEVREQFHLKTLDVHLEHVHAFMA